MFDFPKVDPVERGCGERVPGGMYLESALSPYGRPLEEFLIDPPLPVPDGLDIINKPLLWPRTLPSGDPVCDADEQPIYDVLIWVGGEYYPYCPDFVEEVRRYGASRRLNPNLDLSRLSRWSRMILVHPRARNLVWQTQMPPALCHKAVPGHTQTLSDVHERELADDVEQGEEGASRILESGSGMDETGEAAKQQSVLPAQQEAMLCPRKGPCIFKVWELLPQEAAQTVITTEQNARDDSNDDEDVDDDEEDAGSNGGLALKRFSTRPLCLRRIGSTVYQYHPTGESAEELVPGMFAALPLTGVALIRFADGSVNERAHEKVKAGRDVHGEQALPWYESDR